MTPDVRDRAERRWRDIRAADPGLAHAVALQRELVLQADTVLDALRARGVARPSVPRSVLVARLSQGTPVLRNETVPVPYDRLAASVTACCAILERGSAGAAIRRVRLAIEAGRLDVASLLAASLARDTATIHGAATQLGYAPDVLWLLGELAASPFAHHLQHRLFGDAGTRPPALRSALAAWNRGSCPACGSWPGFAERRPDGRWLRCSFCGLDWAHPGACVYCAAPETELLTHTCSDAAAFEACGRCAGYVKLLAVETPLPFALLAVEDLASHAVDRAAAAAGYGKPSLAPPDEAPAHAGNHDASAP